MSNDILISEIFGPTLQGEGALIGQPTVFVRTGGCDYRCSWCDTMYAVDPIHSDQWHKMSAKDVLEKVDELSDGKIRMITISGGNPALQPLDELIEKGHQKGYRFALETQGSIAKYWFSKLDILTLSPKGPSSGMMTEIGQIQSCLDAAQNPEKAILKIVIFNDDDYQYARDLNEAFPDVKLFLQVGNPEPGSDRLVDIDALLDNQRKLSARVIEERWDHVSVLPQMHVLLWGNKAGV